VVESQSNMIGRAANPRAAPKLRSSALAGCAIAALICGAAEAKTPCTPLVSSQNNPASDSKGLPLIIENADQATGNSKTFLDLSGHVELHYDNRTLTGGEVHYDLQSGRVSGNKGAQITGADGTTEFAQTFDFDNKLQTGVATGFSALLPRNFKMAAASVELKSPTRTELNRVIVTPCALCDADGKPKEPSFSVSADHVVRDEESCRVVYQNATIRLKGVPVFYAPYFSHADPSVEEASGLLQPRFSQTKRRGVSWEQPYLWAIDSSSDLIVSPQINTAVAPYLNLDYRRRFYTGLIDARVGYTYDQDFNSDGDSFGPHRNKAYILADGFFQPTKEWSWGFTAQDASDRRLFDQYGINDLYDAEGLYLNDDRRLINQLYAARQNSNSYFSIAAMSFQSLRTVTSGVPDAFGIVPLENDKTLPIVAPLIEFRFEPEGGFLGGRLRLVGSTAAVEQDVSATNPALNGVDSARLTIQGDWRRSFTLANGLRIEPFGQLRADAYDLTDLPAGTTGTHTPVRSIATAGVDISYPLIRHSGSVTTIIEPIVQVAISPNTKLYPQIPNEDSVAFDFDQTNLFSPNKFPGYDLYEGGQRINTGIQTTVDWGDGRTLRTLVGRSFRQDDDPVFPARTSLDQKASDWIASVDVTPIRGLSFFADAQLENSGLTPRRIEAGANFAVGRTQGYFRYFKEDQDFSGTPREDVEAAGEFFITPNWGVTANAIRDLQNDVWRRRGAGLIYKDDCLRFDFLFQREDNPVLGTRSAQTFVMRLTLATFGNTGYRNNNYRSGTQQVRW
jgi:LPS-assembly protein